MSYFNGDVKLALVNTNLNCYTFKSGKMKKWVEDNSSGYVLNLFAGKTKLALNEHRNDIDSYALSDSNLDALEFVLTYDGPKFNTVILDPPYSYRKAMEMYKGSYCSKFKLLADNITKIIKPDARIISFGYHSTFMGKIRGFKLWSLCVFAHGGAQHCTIGIIEKRS